jgi:hypothetical protein
MHIEVDDPPLLIAANRALRVLRVVLALLIAVALAFGIPAAAADVLAVLPAADLPEGARALGWVLRSPAAVTVLVGLLLQGAIALRAGTSTPARATLLVAVGLVAVLGVGAASLWALGGGAAAVPPMAYAHLVHLSALALLAMVQLLVRP